MGVAYLGSTLSLPDDLGYTNSSLLIIVSSVLLFLDSSSFSFSNCSLFSSSINKLGSSSFSNYMMVNPFIHVTIT